MNEEIIKALKERAKEMLNDDNTRQIGAEEIYTIICEWEDALKENEELKRDKTHSHFELERLEKVIDKMAEYIEDISKDTEVPVHKQAIIDFYYKKVEEENE